MEAAAARVDYYQGGTLLGTVALTSAFTADQGFIAFGSGSLSSIDNISITSVPEPSSVMAAIGGLAGLMLVRRRK